MTHPRLQRFASETTADPAAALAALVADLEAAGGPLVEAVPPTAVDVTFVHLADVARVELKTPLVAAPPPAVSVPLERIPGTDVWHLTVRAPADVAVGYAFLHDPPSAGSSMADMLEMMADPARMQAYVAALDAAAHVDPYNPLALAHGLGDEGAADSTLVLPESPYRPLPADAPVPALTRYELDGRAVDVYQPDGVDPAEPLPLVVLLDGEFFASARIDQRVDAAVRAGLLPPLRLVLWNNLSPTSRMVEMACNPELADALADELLPFLGKHYGVPAEAAQRVIAGFSYGGLATAHTALTRPDAFGGAVAMSPSLWFTPDPATEPGEWLIRRFAATPPSGTAFYVTVGSLEDIEVGTPGSAPGATMVTTARTFRDTLREHGYDLRGYAEIPAGHEALNAHLALVEALAALLT